jgi:parallel beta-helix repeat protein
VNKEEGSVVRMIHLRYIKFASVDEKPIFDNKMEGMARRSHTLSALFAIAIIGLMVGWTFHVMVVAQPAGSSPNEDQLLNSIPASIAYSSHAPISISGDAGFLDPNATTGITNGSGIASDPYVIEGWEISLSPGHGIAIQNADVYFIIRDCYVHNCSFNGIAISTCTNGTIENNDCSYNGRCGIYLSSSSINDVMNNICNYNSNTVYGGIWLDSSSNNNVINNACSSNTQHGIRLAASSNNNVINNTCSSNIQNGIYLLSSSNNTLSNNNCSNNQEGIYLDSSSNNSISCDSVSNSIGYGVNILSGSNNRIWNSTLIGNNGAGSVYNASYTQASDDGTNNLWNSSGAPHGYGNNWSDWTIPDANNDGIVDNPYDISGSAGAKDFYPQVNAIPVASFNVTPLYGNILTNFTFNASGCSDKEDSSSSLNVRWDWENDGTNDTQWSTVKIETHQFSTIGNHAIRLWVEDSKGTINTTKQTIQILNTPPIASFTFTPSAGNQITTFTFNASSSSDLEDLNSSLQVRWDWTNDGIADTPWNTTKTATHSFISGGNYTVRLEVKDTGGLTNNTTRIVPVSNLATKEDIDRIMNYLNDTLRQINELETNLTAYVNQLKELFNDTTDNITKLLNQINTNLTAYVNQLKELFNDTTDNITKLLNQINTNLTAQVNQLDEKLTGAMSNITKLQEQIKKLNTNLTGFDIQLQRRLDYLNISLVAELKNTSDQISSLRLENEQLTNQNDELRQELDEINSSLSKIIDNATDRMDRNLQNSIDSLGWNMMIEWIAVFFALLVMILIVFRMANIETQGAMRMIMEQKKSQIDVSKKKTAISASSPGKESKGKRPPVQRKLAEGKSPDDESMLPPEDTL